MEITDENAIFLLPPPSGSTKFRATVVRQFMVENRHIVSSCTDFIPEHGETLPQTISSHWNMIEKQKYSTLSDIYLATWRVAVAQSKDNNLFSSLRTKEFNVLVDCGVFSLLQTLAAKGNCIYDALFVDTIKNE